MTLESSRFLRLVREGMCEGEGGKSCFLEKCQLRFGYDEVKVVKYSQGRKSRHFCRSVETEKCSLFKYNYRSFFFNRLWLIIKRWGDSTMERGGGTKMDLKKILSFYRMILQYTCSVVKNERNRVSTKKNPTVEFHVYLDF